MTPGLVLLGERQLSPFANATSWPAHCLIAILFTSRQARVGTDGCLMSDDLETKNGIQNRAPKPCPAVPISRPDINPAHQFFVSVCGGSSLKRPSDA